MSEETKKPSSDFWLVNEAHDCFIHVTEGDGTNLLDEDEKEGYVDYIYYTVFDSFHGIFYNEESDGGQIMLRQMYVTLTQEEIVESVLDFIGCAEHDNFSVYN
jgi:hypothetical protein